MASPQPTWQYLVAFNNNSFDDPSAITSVATAPTLGGNNVWTDITQYVSGHKLTRGRQHELSRFEAGMITLDLNDNTGVFDSWNTTGPYYGKLRPGVLLQVRATYSATTYKRFTGMVQGWPTLWPDQFSQWKQVVAYDAFRLFSQMTLQTAAYANQVIADGATNYYRLSESAGLAVDVITGQNGSYQGAGKQAVTGALSSDPNLAYDALAYKGLVQLPSGAGVTAYPFTVEGWINLHALPSATPDADQVFAQTNAAGNHGVTLYLNTNGTVAELQANIADGTTNNVTANFQIVLPSFTGNGTGAWCYFAFTVDATGKIYTVYPGTPVANQTTFGTAASLSGTTVRVGLAANLNGSTIIPGMNGAIDEVAIYRGIALTSAQITNHYNLATAGMALNDYNAGTSIVKALTALGWIDATQVDGFLDNVVLSMTSSVFTATVLSTMQAFEVTGDGAFFMNKAGQPRYIEHASLLLPPYNTSQATYGDNPGAGEFPFAPAPTIAMDDIDIHNQYIVTPTGGANQIAHASADTAVVQSASNATSITQYGLHTSSLSTNHAFNQDAANLATWLVARYAQPVERIRAIIVNPLDAPSTLFPETLSRELCDRITVVRHGAVGAPFRIDALIEHIDEQVTPDTWTVTYGLANALPATAIYNDTTYGRYSDTSPLNGTITAGAGSLVVTIPVNTPAWTTTDVPFNIKVDGEVMTVSAVSALSGGTQTLTLSARGVLSTLAAAHTAGATVQPYPANTYNYV